MNSVITEMWVKACVTFFPAFHHIESTCLTFILALDANWCGWFFSFVRFASEDIFKAYVAS